jgi:CRISPR-associated protein Csa1
MVLPRRVWDYIRSLGAEGGPSAEVRGWRFDLVAPRYAYRPSVGEVASYCPTRRDVYLRRVLGARETETYQGAVHGRLVHEVFLEPFRLVAQGRRSVEDMARAKHRLMRRLGVRSRLLEAVYELGAALALQTTIDGDVPVQVEPGIPGAAVGLADIVRPDLLVGLLPVEVTTASPDSVYGERKRLAVAGYALALEAWTGLPIDYGVILYVRERDGTAWPEWRVVAIDDSLRRRFLRARDEVAMMVENQVDPGVAEECPSWCPFRGACLGERAGGSQSRS